MFITEITKNGPEYLAHNTAQEAVAYVLDTLGPDYTDGPEAIFWSAGNGAALCQSTRHMLDFTARVHATPAHAISAIMGYDAEALPASLRAIANAIEWGLARGME